MERRLLIAVLVSIAFLVLWSAIAPTIFPSLAPPPSEELPFPESDGPAGLGTTPGTSTPAEMPPVGAEVEAAVEESGTAEPVGAAIEEVFTIRGEGYRARITNRGARIVSFRLLDELDVETGEPWELVNQAAGGEGPLSIYSEDGSFRDEVNAALYAVERTGSGSVELSYRSPEGRSVVKKLEFEPDRPVAHYEVRVGGSSSPWGVLIGPGIGAAGSTADDRFALSGTVVVEEGGDADSFARKKVDETLRWTGARYVGLVDHYFVSVLLPSRPAEARAFPVDTPGDGPKFEAMVAMMAEGTVASGRALFAPKRRSLLDEFELSALLDTGFFGPIANLLLDALTLIYGWVGNYGWAIVLLTIVIKILFFPLQHKSMVSMKRMQNVQPKMNAIRERYKKSKSDPAQRQKMNLEMMQLYKDEKISPAAGCVPMLLQLPILWAFYVALSHAIELRGEPWVLWITDLSAKDPIYILPIVMTGTMFIQQLVTPMAVDPMQRKIMLAMPIVFGFIFKEFPAGLVLYWLVQNVLTIIQQGLLNRWWKLHPESLEVGKGQLATAPARQGRGKR